MKIRIAKLDEVPQVRRWLVDTAKWLDAKDIHQWERFLVYEATKVCLKDYYNNKLFVLLDNNENMVGALSYGGDPEEIDKKLWEDYESAYFIHRIVVGKQYRGMKYGEYMIRWAKKLAMKDNREVRLNCVECNDYLYKYYQAQGFKYCGSKMGYHLFRA
ncbi:GNAT family N-acetyltransferase [Clostridium paraputrificum]|uniref:GNAT family N-acetyltransferase n=1 Tax=Clostridium TaxID=1485 RepID=UPI003D34443C